jgi:hypothetical protein
MNKIFHLLTILSFLFFVVPVCAQNNNKALLSPTHSKDTFSIYEEDAVFQVKLNNSPDNPSNGECPKLHLTFPDGTTETYDMDKDGGNGTYTCILHLEMGSYDYKYITTTNQGLYEVSGKWHVTSRPYNFVVEEPNPSVQAPTENVCFSWRLSTDETDDRLSYEMYIGHDNAKENLPKVADGPGVNALSLIISKLEHKKQYYWYMKVKNKYGALLETEMFSFTTGGIVNKFYNAPNPFYPANGMKTDFVFPMRYDGMAQIIIYSEYGDKVWESESLSFSGGSSHTIRYDGRDNCGKILYEGSYLAVLNKKYQNKTEMQKCRILVIR